MDLVGINFSDLRPSNKFISIQIINHESLRAYNEYRSVWTSIQRISLSLDPEQSLLRKYHKRPSVGGHLPRYISNFAHWFMKRYVDIVNEHNKEPGIEMFDDVTISVIPMSESQTWKSTLRVKSGSLTRYESNGHI